MINRANRLNTVREYYFSTKLKEIYALKKSGKPIVNIAIGSPDLAPPESVIKAIQNEVSHAHTHQYQSYIGIPELREAIQKFSKKHYNVNVNPTTEVLPLMGSKEGVMHITMAFVNAGDHVLIPNPGYPTYSAVTALVGGKSIQYDLTEENNWYPDFKELEKLDLTKVKLMWVNYPHMPTGAKGNKALFKKMIAFTQEHNILLVNDNPYSFILNNNPQSILSIENAKKNTLELNSLSKTFNMAGWRVGWVLGNEKYLKSILKVKSNMDSGMFLGIQKGAIEALHQKYDWFTNLNSTYEKRLLLVWQLFDKVGVTY